MDNALTIIFLLLSSKGSFLYNSNMAWVVIIAGYLAVGFQFKRFTYYDLKIITNFAAVYMALMIFRYIFLNHLPFRYLVTDIVFLIKYLFVCFLYCALLKDRAMIYIVKVIAWGAAISIPFYFLQLPAGPQLLAFGKKLHLASDIEGYTNFLVFTYVEGHRIRNCGFTWEPGAYGCFLNLAFMINIVQNNFVFDRKCKWIAAAVITTLSTTTYLAFLVNLLLYYRGNGGKLTTLIFIAGPALVILSTQLPFLLSKIENIYVHDMNDIENINFLSEFYLENGGELPLNRFSSAIYIYDLFGIQLLWGVSNPYQDTIQILKNINISNGIIDFAAKFGFISLVYNLYLYGKFFATYRLKGELIFYCILVLLFLSFGEPILILPVSLLFLFINYYVDAPVYEESVDLDALKFA